MSCLPPTPRSAHSEGYAKLYKSELFSDAEVVAHGQSWNVHKVVLSGASDYFKKAFHPQFLEGQNSRIELQDETTETVEAVLQYIYTNTYTLEKSTVGNNLRVLIALDKYLVVERGMFEPWGALHQSIKAGLCLIQTGDENKRGESVDGIGELIDAIPLVYAGDVAALGSFDRPLMGAIQARMNELMEREDFTELLERVPGFAVKLIQDLPGVDFLMRHADCGRQHARRTHLTMRCRKCKATGRC